MQQYHYHLIRDERDASIMEEPPASKVKWPSPGQFMMNKLWLAFMSSSKLLWTGQNMISEKDPVTLILTWQGGGAGLRPDGLYNVIMNQSYWGTIVQTLHLQLDSGLNLGDLKKISGSIFYVGTFLSSNCPLSLSWQRVNTWNWATWTRGRGETLWRVSLLAFLW